MITSFPSYVFVDLGTYSIKRNPNYRRDEFETGPVRQVKTDCKAIYDLSFKIQICKENYEDFMSWFNQNLVQGTRRFKFTDPAFGTERVVRFVGNELEFKLVGGELLEANMVVEFWN